MALVYMPFKCGSRAFAYGLEHIYLPRNLDPLDIEHNQNHALLAKGPYKISWSIRCDMLEALTGGKEHS